MATIIVEDGSGKTDANSYVSEVELTAYATDRGVTLTGTASVLLIQAMDYIESLMFIGDKKTVEQALQWPRNNVYIDGYCIEPSTIPVLLKSGLMATCIAIDIGNDPLADVDRAVKSEKLDVMSVEYMDNAASETINRTINAALRKIIRGGGAMRVWRS